MCTKTSEGETLREDGRERKFEETDRGRDHRLRGPTVSLEKTDSRSVGRDTDTPTRRSALRGVGSEWFSSREESFELKGIRDGQKTEKGPENFNDNNRICYLK